MLKNARMEDDGKTIVIHIPMKFKRRGGRKQIILPPEAEEQDDKPPTPLQIALARAYSWRKILDSGEAESIGEIADTIGIDPSLVGKHLRLPFSRRILLRQYSLAMNRKDCVWSNCSRRYRLLGKSSGACMASKAVISRCMKFSYNDIQNCDASSELDTL